MPTSKAPNTPVQFLRDFRIKEMASDVLHKARCAISGDKQVSSRDFDFESFYAPVARCKLIHILLVKGAVQNHIALTANISNAYLYENIDRDIYMQ